MAILTVDELREHVETTLGDDALQRLLDAAEDAIVAYAGAPGSAVEIVDGGYRKLVLSRPASAISTIVERRNSVNTTLTAGDFRLRGGGYVLDRLNDGTNRRSTWDELVTVTYTPVDDSDLRAVVQIALCRLLLNQNPGRTQEQIGAWLESFQASKDWNFRDEWAAVLSQLAPEPMLGVVGG